MAVTTRWNTVRLDKKLTDALAHANSSQLENDYRSVAEDVARETGDRIRASGRGGAHNSEFANIQQRVFRSAAGRYNILVGWLNPGPGSAERGSGGKLWFQYQDSGFHLFGGSNWIEGVGATLDQRYRLIEGLEDVNIRHINRIAGILNR
jgi:hypothetical protein